MVDGKKVAKGKDDLTSTRRPPPACPHRSTHCDRPTTGNRWQETRFPHRHAPETRSLGNAHRQVTPPTLRAKTDYCKGSPAPFADIVNAVASTNGDSLTITSQRRVSSPSASRIKRHCRRPNRVLSGICRRCDLTWCRLLNTRHFRHGSSITG